MVLKTSKVAYDYAHWLHFYYLQDFLKISLDPYLHLRMFRVLGIYNFGMTLDNILFTARKKIRKKTDKNILTI